MSQQSMDPLPLCQTECVARAVASDVTRTADREDRLTKSAAIAARRAAAMARIRERHVASVARRREYAAKVFQWNTWTGPETRAWVPSSSPTPCPPPPLGDAREDDAVTHSPDTETEATHHRQLKLSVLRLMKEAVIKRRDALAFQQADVNKSAVPLADVPLPSAAKARESSSMDNHDLNAFASSGPEPSTTTFVSASTRIPGPLLNPRTTSVKVRPFQRDQSSMMHPKRSVPEGWSKRSTFLPCSCPPTYKHNGLRCRAKNRPPHAAWEVPIDRPQARPSGASPKVVASAEKIVKGLGTGRLPQGGLLGLPLREALQVLKKESKGEVRPTNVEAKERKRNPVPGTARTETSGQSTAIPTPTSLQSAASVRTITIDGVTITIPRGSGSTVTVETADDDTVTITVKHC